MTRPGRTRALTLRAVVLIAAVLVGTGLGGWRAVSMAATGPDPSTLVVNGVSYTIAHTEQVKGLSDADLGGMSHGVQSLVSDDKALVTVTLVVAAGDSPSSYDASVLRAFATGSPVAISPVGGTLAPGRLSAHAHIEGSLSFVVPRNGAQLTLRASGDSREVPLLQVDNAPAGAGEHPHPSASASVRVPTPPRVPTPQQPRTERQPQIAGPAGDPHQESGHVVTCSRGHHPGHRAGRADRESERAGHRVRVGGTDIPAHRVGPSRQPRRQRDAKLSAIAVRRADRSGPDAPKMVIKDLNRVRPELDALTEGQSELSRCNGQDIPGNRVTALELGVG